MNERFGRFVNYSFDAQIFDPIFAIAEILDNTQTKHVKFRPFELKTLISTCVDHNQLERTASSGSEKEVINSDDDDSRHEFVSAIMASSLQPSTSRSDPLSIADKYLVNVCKKDKIEPLEFWKNIEEDLVIVFFYQIYISF